MTELPARESFTYSVVIPVYNSAEIVGETVDRVVRTFTEAGLRHQVVLVNDGSSDGSWDIIAERARTTPGVLALDLMKNYGQHYANLAGLREATGDWVITMDDDLQNPPDQALVLIDKALEGHEVVFGQFEQKQAAGHRRIGSRLIGLINRRVFGQPQDLVVSNFRILRRDVVDRIVGSRTAYPYITGQALMFSGQRANAVVRHDPRPAGKSTYSLAKILTPGVHDPVQLQLVAAARGCAAGLRDLRAQLPAGRLPGDPRARDRQRGAGLDVDHGAAVVVRRLHHRAALDDRRVRRPHPQHRQHRRVVPRRTAGGHVTHLVHGLTTSRLEPGSRP